ncbi:MAG: hypothetical protein UEJ45_03965 [Peptococcaceae bacterium]|nr:hypothetical protein [Peptococcaceae bacterium]DAW36946.1 MAG TPA: Alginate and motility regulator [Caudoviricetes sp.]
MMTAKKMGRPPIGNPRNKTIQMRMTQDELDKIQQCADILKESRTNTILKGIDLLMKSLEKEK